MKSNDRGVTSGSADNANRLLDLLTKAMNARVRELRWSWRHHRESFSSWSLAPTEKAEIQRVLWETYSGRLEELTRVAAMISALVHRHTHHHFAFDFETAHAVQREMAGVPSSTKRKAPRIGEVRS